MLNIEVTYGDEILDTHMRKLNNYVVITDPIPWNLYQHLFQQKPKKVIMPGTLDKDLLDEMIETIPQDVEFVGLGGGAVIDAAKYFAYLRDRTPTLIPTITSSNAHFSDFISVQRNGAAFGFKKIGWPKQVIVDYALIEMADPRWNRAGYGDLLFLQTALNDWVLAAQEGKAMPVDPRLEEAVKSIMQDAIEHAEEIGSMSKRGLDRLIKLIEKSSRLIMDNLTVPLSAGAEHLFAWNFEQVTGRHLIHGELVSLGIIITSYLQKRNYHELKDALDKANVIYHPDQLQVSWEEIKETLLTVGAYNRKFRNFYTIFDQVEWTKVQLKEIQDVIYAR
ncbi:iron-containing alcohol dehydrogenase [Virgibacillus ndiopensis]|uniref:iron-containing alcohol dehydrogenase n=1 Tax=Virgibacillus ndiopensis TaxID=2004408 RepID=UPI000C08B440|nr:iron-containing alcohol dehydrogenase [Virgibacillus ndiopensis]